MTRTGLASALLALALAAGCSTSPAPSTAAPPAPTPAPAAEAPKKPTPRAASAEEALGLRAPADVPGEDERLPAPKPYFDPELGRRVVKIPKGGAASQYFEKDGRLYLAIIPGEGVPILRQDAAAWIVEAPRERKIDPKAGMKPEDAPPPVIEMPKSESEVVTPKTSKDTLRFEEISAGLPRSGMWRENFDLGDVLGEGRPQIVSPPARLTGKSIQVFRLDKDANGAPRWKVAELEVDNPENVDAGYGVTTVADLDGDGRPDIVYGGHGIGPAVAYNLGGGKFRVALRGLPRQMSTRAIAAADVNGDGRTDLIAISDDLEWSSVRGQPQLDPKTLYLRGYDVRLFLNEKDGFREVHRGLEGACFGYSIAVVAPPPSEGLPFYGSACRYVATNSMLYEYDPKAEEFHALWPNFAEDLGQHTGAAAGRYLGRPAIFASWFKRSPYGAQPKIDGQGITVYYRGADGKMASRRVIKTLEWETASYAIAAGDLNGDGLDDVVWGDEITGRLRVFFQTKDGAFEELAEDREPTFVNHPTCLRIADVDGDGRKDVVLMYQYLTGDETRAGGFRVFRNLAK